MKRPDGCEYNTTARTLRSRKARRCDGHRCGSIIKPGDLYVRYVVFPGYDVISCDRPQVIRQCLACATKSGRALPPTIRERRLATQAAARRGE